MRSFITITFIILSLSLNAQIESFIPEPKSVVLTDDEFILDENTEIKSRKSDHLENEVEYLQQFLPTKSSFDDGGVKSRIELSIEENIEKSEAYFIVVKPNKIEIRAKDKPGIFYAIQTLLQMFPSSVYNNKTINEISIPTCRIYDEPKFSYRGMLLDCSRHFMDKDFILRYIDLLAYHKMNVLHLHLTEDQGWRVEIKKYPKLTEVGAWRKDINNESEGDLYGGFYTREELKEIVRYSEKRHVVVIPEIEMPGHSQAALAAYPQFSCTGGPFEVETEWGVFKEIYCVGNDETFLFLKDILEEVLEIFPSKFIHIGADEVPKYRWEHCEKCQTLKDKLKLENEEELQSFFLSKINHYLQSRDRVMVGWDEVAEGGLPENCIVQSWRGFDGAINAVDNNHFTIVSPTSHAYFDYDLKAIDLEKVYSFNPIAEEISQTKSHFVLGGTCNMWSERAPQETVDSKVFPRILAMSEVLWSDPEIRDYGEFYKKVQLHYNRLDAMNVDYGFETIPFKYKSESFDGVTFVKLIPNISRLDLSYSINGSDFQEYEEEILLDEDIDLEIKATKNGKAYGDPILLNYSQHKAISCSVELETMPDKSYDPGIEKLHNGFSGSTDFRDGQWLGFFGDDMIAVIALEEETEVSEISLGFLQYINSWIFLPASIEVFLSEDGEKFIKGGKVISKTSKKERGRILEELNVKVDPQNVKYIKVKAKNIGLCPDWHEAAGSKAWLFVDEINIK